MIRRISIPRCPGSLFPSLMAAACLLFFAGQAHGQEALRMSLAGDLAAQSQRQAENTIGYYNLLWGPVAWRFSSGLELDYNDNVRLQSQNQEGDFIVRPNLNTKMHWPVTQKNSLDVVLGAGYSLYASHSELNRFYVNPGSGLSFNIYAGDCVINLHDRISITENAYQNPTANGNVNYEQLENTAGTSALGDLNKLMAQLGYDHGNNISLGSSQQFPDTTSENWSLYAGVHFLPEITAGVEGGFGLISYDQNQSTAIQPDAMQWNAGMFCKAQISKHISGRLDAGYTVYTTSTTGAFTRSSSMGSMYFQFSVSHQVNRFLNYSLSAGRSTESTSYGQPVDQYFVRLQPSCNIFRKYQLSTPFWWKKGTQLYARGGATGTDYNQYGAGINISHAITQKLSGSLAYQLIRESSGQSSLNYTVNIVSLNFSYQF
ncbi:MAG: hypothetical protein ABSE90_01190 [Verrucomicrobiota bacterium]